MHNILGQVIIAFVVVAKERKTTMTEWQAFLMYIGIITLSTVVAMLSLFAFEAIITGIRKLKQIFSNRQQFKEKSVVHGRWEQVDETKCRCSNCDIIALIGLYPHGDKNYCPNCGAKMDMEEHSG